MKVIAIDPGTEESAYVVYEDGRIVLHGIDPNATLRDVVAHWGSRLVSAVLVVEQVESFGMPVGREVFETVFWSGRFVEAWGGDFVRMPRRLVKVHLCHSSRATDANIRQAIYDAYNGKLRAVGTKANPGPLFGLKGHEYAALAVAMTYRSQQLQNRSSQPRVAAEG